MNLMQPEPTVDERQNGQTQTVTPAKPLSLTESTPDAQSFSPQAFKAIYGADSDRAIAAFNADAATRGPGAALDQLAERPGAYIPGTEPSPVSRAVAGSLRASVPESDTRTGTEPEVRTEPEVPTDSPVQDDPPRRIEINDVSIDSKFKMAVGSAETQETVLRRSYQEYAFKAGISNERMSPDSTSPREAFVEERMADNYARNKEKYLVGNPNTQNAYDSSIAEGPDAWVNLQGGEIWMSPTPADMVALEQAQQQSRENEGTRLGEEVLQLLDAGDEFSAARVLGFTNPDELIGRAMETVSRNAGDVDFQRGFVEKLEAAGFIRLSQKYADQPVYSAILTRSLSDAIVEVPSEDGVIQVSTSIDGSIPVQDQLGEASNIAVSIARQADSETLARLLANPDHSLGTEFLIEASKSVLLSPKDFGNGREFVLARAAEDSRAAFQLLEDPKFVQAAAKRIVGSAHAPDPNHAVLSRFIESGLSAEMQAMDPGRFANVLSSVVEYVTQPGGSILNPSTVGSQSRGSYPIMNGNLADALAKAYTANPQMFTDAAMLPGGRKGQLDGQDVRALMVAIKPFADRKDSRGHTVDDQILAASAAEYVRLLNRAVETGKAGDADALGYFAGTILDGQMQANTTEARAANARREKLNEYILTAAGYATGGVTKVVGGVAVDILSKSATGDLKEWLKSDSVARAETKNREDYFGQFSANNVAILGAVSRASTSDRDSRTVEQRTQDEQFKSNIATYNSGLKAGQKILDDNGDLIPTATASRDQLTNMERLVRGIAPEGSTDPNVARAAGEVRDSLRDMVTNINNATGLQKSPQ